MAEENEDSTKRDLRFSSVEEKGVRIDRNLDGSGHLARGDKTKMSMLNFSSRHQARTERDPDFEFRPAPAKPAPPAEPAAPPVAPAPAVASEPETGSMVDKIKGFFGF